MHNLLRLQNSEELSSATERLGCRSRIWIWYCTDQRGAGPNSYLELGKEHSDMARPYAQLTNYHEDLKSFGGYDPEQTSLLLGSVWKS